MKEYAYDQKTLDDSQELCISFNVSCMVPTSVGSSLGLYSSEVLSSMAAMLCYKRLLVTVAKVHDAGLWMDFLTKKCWKLGNVQDSRIWFPIKLFLVLRVRFVWWERVLIGATEDRCTKSRPVKYYLDKVILFKESQIISSRPRAQKIWSFIEFQASTPVVYYI